MIPGVPNHHIEATFAYFDTRAIGNADRRLAPTHFLLCRNTCTPNYYRVRLVHIHRCTTCAALWIHDTSRTPNLRRTPA